MEPVRLLPRARREATEAAVGAWLSQRSGSLGDGYIGFLGSAVHTSGVEDPEVCERKELCNEPRNRLRWLIDNFQVPGDVSFDRLGKRSLEDAFGLEPVQGSSGNQEDPSLPKLTRTPSVKIKLPRKAVEQQTAADAAAEVAAALGVEIGDDNIGDDAQKHFMASRLAHVLEDTVERLIAVRFPRNPFANMQYPNDNPFAVRIEKNGNVVPPNYFDVVKEPMDLTKMKEKVMLNSYNRIEELEKDVKLIIANSRVFYPKGSPVVKAASTFEREARKIIGAAKNRLRKGF